MGNCCFGSDNNKDDDHYSSGDEAVNDLISDFKYNVNIFKRTELRRARKEARRHKRRLKELEHEDSEKDWEDRSKQPKEKEKEKEKDKKKKKKISFHMPKFGKKTKSSKVEAIELSVLDQKEYQDRVIEAENLTKDILLISDENTENRGTATKLLAKPSDDSGNNDNDDDHGTGATNMNGDDNLENIDILEVIKMDDDEKGVGKEDGSKVDFTGFEKWKEKKEKKQRRTVKQRLTKAQLELQDMMDRFFKTKSQTKQKYMKAKKHDDDSPFDFNTTTTTTPPTPPLVVIASTDEKREIESDKKEDLQNTDETVLVEQHW